MSQKLNMAIIGCGRFANHFVELFKNHPNVDKVYVCDLDSTKAGDFSARYGVETVGSFEEALGRKDINCIGNFTRRHTHGSITIRALKAGKHVFSAVPMASSVEECVEIVELVKTTGLTYLIGETCYYYPCAMFCREAYQTGKFGDFAYGEAQYYHHINEISYGSVPRERGMPPLFYPTHSTAMILSAADSYVKKVSCFGCRDKSGDRAFTAEGNPWGNEFLNQYMLLELANGGTARVTEARGFGWGRPSSYISNFYGTKGSYEFSNAQHLLVETDFYKGEKPFDIRLTDVSDYVNPEDMVRNKDLPDFKQQVAHGKWQWDSFAAVQAKEVARLPESFRGLKNGHMGSHQFLVDDFCRAVYSGEMPVLNAWFAARCNIPGLVAVESAKLGGVTMEVPDCGDAPGKK